MTGIASDIKADWLVDFNTDYTVVWAEDCFSHYGNCSEAPLYLNCSYVATSKSLEPFENLVVGGYTISGYIYEDLVCVESTCLFVNVYAVTYVDNDAWLLN